MTIKIDWNEIFVDWVEYCLSRCDEEVTRNWVDLENSASYVNFYNFEDVVNFCHEYVYCDRETWGYPYEYSAQAEWLMHVDSVDISIVESWRYYDYLPDETGTTYDELEAWVKGRVTFEAKE